MIVYFSGTGNSRFAAEFLAKQLGDELLDAGRRYFVLTCGGEIGNAGQYAAQLCEEMGLNYKGVLEVVMPENYIAMFDVPSENESRKMVMAAKMLLQKNAESVCSWVPTPSLLRRILCMS